MSPELMVAKSPALTCTPSIIYRGSVLPLIDPCPRMVTTAGDPGWPLCDRDSSPGIFPWSALSNDPSGCILISSPEILEMEPVTCFLFCVPYPVTNTSCKLREDCSSIIFVDAFSAETSLSRYPTLLIMRIDPAGAEILNCPSGPVVVP